MNDRPNPYAPPAADLVTAPDRVIHFHGTLTGEELMMTLRERPPRRGDRWRVLGLVLLSAVMCGHGAYEVLSGAHDRLGATLFLVAGAYASMFGWVLLIRQGFPYHRQRVKRVTTAGARQQPQSGWLDEQGLTVVSPNSVFQAGWAAFGPVLLFPQQVMLPMAIDQGRRIPLPWRFFRTPQDVEDVRALLKRHVGIRRRFKPTPVARRAEGEPLLARPPGGAWTASDGPWPTQAPGETFSIDLGRVITRSRYLVVFLLNVVFVAACLLPIWLATAFWALCRFQQTGEVWGLLDEPLEPLIAVGPPVVAMGMVIFQFLAAMHRSRRFHSEPATIIIRDRQLYLATATYQSWFAPAAMHRLIEQPDAAGWVFEETLEEVKLPRECFEDEREFTRFVEALRAFAESPSDL